MLTATHAFFHVNNFIYLGIQYRVKYIKMEKKIAQKVSLCNGAGTGNLRMVFMRPFIEPTIL